MYLKPKTAILIEAEGKIFERIKKKLFLATVARILNLNNKGLTTNILFFPCMSTVDLHDFPVCKHGMNLCMRVPGYQCLAALLVVVYPSPCALCC